MNHLRQAFMIGSTIALVGCGAPSESASDPAPADPREQFQSTVEHAVKANLKDPNSAEFMAVLVFPQAKTACGRVNARNSFGGYTGFQQFAYLDGVVTMEDQSSATWKAAFNRCTLASKEAALTAMRGERQIIAADDSLAKSDRAVRLEKIDKQIERFESREVPLLR